MLTIPRAFLVEANKMMLRSMIPVIKFNYIKQQFYMLKHTPNYFIELL